MDGWALHNNTGWGQVSGEQLVGKVLDVLIVNKRDMGQQQVPGTPLAKNSLGCMNWDRVGGRGDLLVIIPLHSLVVRPHLHIQYGTDTIKPLVVQERPLKWWG